MECLAVCFKLQMTCICIKYIISYQYIVFYLDMFEMWCSAFTEKDLQQV